MKDFIQGDSRRIFVLAVILNYPWERAQSVLYRAEDGSAIPWWQCFSMSLGDGLLVLLIFGAGRAVFGNPAWFARPGLRGYLLMAVAGLARILPLEWIMMNGMKWWSYTADTYLIPGFAVSVSPIIQVLLLPPLIFWIVARWRKGITSTA